MGRNESNQRKQKTLTSILYETFINHYSILDPNTYLQNATLSLHWTHSIFKSKNLEFLKKTLFNPLFNNGFFLLV